MSERSGSMSDWRASMNGVATERTELAWRRTTLSGAVLVVLAVSRTLTSGGRPLAIAATSLIALMWLLAVGFVLVGAILLAAPSAAERFWAWPLTALSARAIGAWFLAYGATAAWVAWEGDPIRARPAALAYAAFGGLGLIAILRFPETVSWGSPRTILLVGALVASVVGGATVAALVARRPGPTTVVDEAPTVPTEGAR